MKLLWSNKQPVRTQGSLKRVSSVNVVSLVERVDEVERVFVVRDLGIEREKNRFDSLFISFHVVSLNYLVELFNVLLQGVLREEVPPLAAAEHNVDLAVAVLEAVPVEAEKKKHNS